MGDNSIMNIESTGKVMMISVILLLMVLLLVIALHLYVRWFWRRVELESYPAAVAVAVPLSGVVAASGAELGLDLKVLGSLPVLVFRRDEFRDGLECAVCLCEVVDGEKARVLPRCGHGFHVECIDMWLQSHVTCPLCRKNAVDEELSRKDIVIADVNGSSGSDQAVDGMQNSDLPPNFPTNVLFWGNETQVSSGSNNVCLEDGNTPTSSSSSDGSSGMNSNGSSGHVGLDIDIPVQAGERSRLGSEETKSPVHARFRSLRRLLSRDRDRRVTPSIHGETEATIDVEMGLRGQPC